MYGAPLACCDMWIRATSFVTHYKIVTICKNLLKNCQVNILKLVHMLVSRTGMAQRQRAGLITPRSQDRNLLPVIFFSPRKPQYFSKTPPALRYSP